MQKQAYRLPHTIFVNLKIRLPQTGNEPATPVEDGHREDDEIQIQRNPIRLFRLDAAPRRLALRPGRLYPRDEGGKNREYKTENLNLAHGN